MYTFCFLLNRLKGAQYCKYVETHFLPYISIRVIEEHLLRVVCYQINNPIHRNRPRRGQVLRDERRTDDTPAICKTHKQAKKERKKERKKKIVEEIQT